MKRMLRLSWLLFALLTLVKLDAQPGQDPKMKAFIDGLMKKMTLQEKIGQLNLPAAGDITTGQAGSSDIARKIEEGKVGGLFNIKSVDKIREVQRLAVEKSRLKIPLLFGMDVIHGYETVFPIPLGLSATWDMNAIERSARIAAQEASADGINWTFSPMVDRRHRSEPWLLSLRAAIFQWLSTILRLPYPCQYLHAMPWPIRFANHLHRDQSFH